MTRHKVDTATERRSCAVHTVTLSASAAAGHPPVAYVTDGWEAADHSDGVVVILEMCP